MLDNSFQPNTSRYRDSKTFNKCMKYIFFFEKNANVCVTVVSWFLNIYNTVVVSS